ncbi:MAG: hypothetical protein LQ341_002004 [Variospora aurantia]|nr:MAG: hypothetical protein LQ341_002004 [Variospora aurantia]
MSTGNDISRIAPGTLLDIPAVMREFNAVWDEYGQFARLYSNYHCEHPESGLPGIGVYFGKDDFPTDAQQVPRRTHWTEKNTLYALNAFTGASLLIRAQWTPSPSHPATRFLTP